MYRNYIGGGYYKLHGNELDCLRIPSCREDRFQTESNLVENTVKVMLMLLFVVYTEKDDFKHFNYQILDNCYLLTE